MSDDVAWALQTARQVGPIAPPHAHAHPIHKLHTGPLHSHVAGRTDHLPSNVPNGSYVLPADIVSAMGEGNTMSGFRIAKRMFEGAKRRFGGTPYAGDNGPYGQGLGTPYGMAEGGKITIGRNEKQSFVGPGYEEWEMQPSSGVPDPSNAVTGPVMPQDGPSFQEQLENNRNRQDIIDQHVGTPLAKGGEVKSTSRLEHTIRTMRAREVEVPPEFEEVARRRNRADGGRMEEGVPVAVAGGEHVLAPHEVMFAGMGDMDAGHRALDAFVVRQRAKTVKTLKGLPGPKRD